MTKTTQMNLSKRVFDVKITVLRIDGQLARTTRLEAARARVVPKGHIRAEIS